MAKRIAYLSVLTALALILSAVERMFPPPVALPGVRLGLANLCTLVALYAMGAKEAALVSVVRVALSGALFGGAFSFIYALSGALLALLAMIPLKKSGAFTPVGVSAAGGAAHNMGQLVVAAVAMGAARIWYYACALLAAGTISGALTGAVCALTIKRLWPDALGPRPPK